MTAPVWIILNGSKAHREDVHHAISTMREQGYPLEVHTTSKPHDAFRLAQQAAQQGIATVVAAGGDGTLHEVVNGLLNTKNPEQVALGCMPLGTANDFATACHISLDPMEALSFALGCRRPTRIDVGKANDQYFLNMATGGLGAQISATTPSELKNLVGASAYVLHGFLTVLVSEGERLTMQGTDWREDRPLLVAAVGNSIQSGGGIELTPEAKLNDGLLDVLSIRDFHLTEIQQVIAEFQEPTSFENQYVKYRQVSWLEARSMKQGEIHFTLDGEPLLAHQIHFEICPQQLSFLLPDEGKYLLI